MIDVARKRDGDKQCTGFRRHRVSQRTRATRQMGPASLPTPLSPTRGQLRRDELGIRCFAILLHRSADIRVCHRRSHRHPDPPSGEVLLASRAEAFSTARSPPSTGGSAVGYRKPVPRAVALRPVRRPFETPPSGAGRAIRPVTQHHHTSFTVAPVSGRSHRQEVLQMCADRFRHVIPV